MPLTPGTLGATIRTARMEQNLSQEELAELVNITPTHLKHLESEHRKPSIEVLFKLVETLHISLDHLLLDKDETDMSQTYIKIKCMLEKCTDKELAIIFDVIQSLLRNR